MKPRKNALLTLAFGLALPLSATAATFDVPAGDATQLQTFLDTASNNSEDNVINLAAGTYVANGQPFLYNANKNNSLKIVGAGKGLTILDGNLTSRVLRLTNQSIAGNAGIAVQGVTVRNGADNANAGNAGLFMGSNGGLLEVAASEFLDNTDGEDGAAATLSVTLGGVKVSDSTFSGNHALGDAGALQINSIASSQDIVLERNEFLGNRADGDAGALRIESQLAAARLTGNRFFDNRADNVGGLLLNVATATLDGNKLEANRAIGQEGGARIQSDGDVTITNSIVIRNESGQDVGGLSILNDDGVVTLTNNTVSGNRSGDDIGGVSIEPAQDSASVRLYNNILFGNDADDDVQDIQIANDPDGDNAGIAVESSHNDLPLLVLTCVDPGCTATISEDQNINADPLFTDLPVGDVQLLPASPAINAGDPAAPALTERDFAGNSRVQDGAPDLGALEVSPFDVSLGEIDFGTVEVGAASASSEVTLRNNSNQDLQVTAMNLGDATNFALDVQAGTDPCGTNTPLLASGESCTVGLTFRPQSAGQFQSQLSVTTDNAEVGERSVDLRGIGEANGNGNGDGGGCSFNPNATSTSLGFVWSLLGMGGLALLRRGKSTR